MVAAFTNAAQHYQFLKSLGFQEAGRNVLVQQHYLQSLRGLVDGRMDFIPELMGIFQVHFVERHDMGPLAILCVVQLQL